MPSPDFFRKTLNQIHRCYENKHASGHKVFVSQFGNITKDGFFAYYELGLDLTYWKEITIEEFSKEARPEAMVLIDFVKKHQRLPNYILNSIPYEYRAVLP